MIILRKNPNHNTPDKYVKTDEDKRDPNKIYLYYKIKKKSNNYFDNIYESEDLELVDTRKSNVEFFNIARPIYAIDIQRTVLGKEMGKKTFNPENLNDLRYNLGLFSDEIYFSYLKKKIKKKEDIRKIEEKLNTLSKIKTKITKKKSELKKNEPVWSYLWESKHYISTRFNYQKSEIDRLKMNKVAKKSIMKGLKEKLNSIVGFTVTKPEDITTHIKKLKEKRKEYKGTNEKIKEKNRLKKEIRQFKKSEKEYSDLLESPESPTQDQLKKAYIKQARKFHPDKNKSDDATKRFQEIGQANEYFKKKFEIDELEIKLSKSNNIKIKIEKIIIINNNIIKNYNQYTKIKEEIKKIETSYENTKKMNNIFDSSDFYFNEIKEKIIFINKLIDFTFSNSSELYDFISSIEEKYNKTSIKTDEIDKFIKNLKILTDSPKTENYTMALNILIDLEIFKKNNSIINNFFKEWNKIKISFKEIIDLENKLSEVKPLWNENEKGIKGFLFNILNEIEIKNTINFREVSNQFAGIEKEYLEQKAIMKGIYDKNKGKFTYLENMDYVNDQYIFRGSDTTLSKVYDKYSSIEEEYIRRKKELYRLFFIDKNREKLRELLKPLFPY